MITEETIKSIMGITNANNPKKDIVITNNVIDGFISYLSQNDNLMDFIVLESINMFNNVDRISADKEHINKLVNSLNDLQRNINHKIDNIQKKYTKSLRPIEEWTKEELIEHIKNKEKF